MTTKSSNGKKQKINPKGARIPGKNPTLFAYAGKSAANLTTRLATMFEKIEKHGKDGVPLPGFRFLRRLTEAAVMLCHVRDVEEAAALLGPVEGLTA